MIAQIVATIIKIKPNYYLNFNPQYKKLKEFSLIYNNYKLFISYKVTINYIFQLKINKANIF